MSALEFHALYRQQDEDAAEEAREERIAERAEFIANRLAQDGEFCGESLIELYDDALAHVLRSVGEFAARYEAEPSGKTTDATLAAIGYSLWKSLMPYLEHAAREQAATDARDEIIEEDATNQADADEARAA